MNFWKDLDIFCKNNDLDPTLRTSIEACRRGWVSPDIDVSDGRDLTADDIDAMTGGQIGTIHVPCPYCGSHKPYSTRFKIERPSLAYARYHCFYCGRTGSVSSDGPVDPVKEAEARRSAAELDNERKAQKTAEALQLWDEATSLPPEAISYFRARGIMELPPGVDDVLRWHSDCRFGWQRRGVMLALFRDVKTDEPVAVHRTAVTEHGVALGRMALGPIARAAIKLWPLDGDQIAVGEGIETVLAAALHVRRDLQPAWALAVANNLKFLPVIRGVRRLTIFVDNDEAGREAAESCSRRWCDAGRAVVKLTPNIPDADFNDLVRVK